MEEYNLMQKIKYGILIVFLFDVACKKLTYDGVLSFDDEKINDILKVLEPSVYEKKIRSFDKEEK